MTDSAEPDPYPATHELAPEPPAPPDTGPRADGMAVAATILGALGLLQVMNPVHYHRDLVTVLFRVALGLLGIPFGIAGLRRIAHKDGRGRGLAIAGIVTSSIFLAIVVLSVATYPSSTQVAGGSTPEPAPSPTRTPTSAPTDPGTELPAGTVYSENLRAGDCTVTPLHGDNIVTYKLVPCAQPHTAEIVATFVYPPGRYPGRDAMDTMTLDRCRPLARQYIGTRPPPMARRVVVVTLIPTPDSWSADLRSASCLARDRAERPLTGSIRGTRR